MPVPSFTPDPCPMYVSFSLPSVMELMSIAYFSSESADVMSALLSAAWRCLAPLGAAWCRLVAADDWLAHAESEVQARQALNALHALDQCVQEGYTWLLHCDADELFYPGPHATDVKVDWQLEPMAGRWYP